MPVDDRFIRALTEISPDLAEQYLRQYHPTEVLESRPPKLEDEPVSTCLLYTSPSPRDS